MGEVTFGEWLDHYQRVPWSEYDAEVWNPLKIYNDLGPVQEALVLPARTDYYQQVRAALAIEVLFHSPPPVLHGAAAYACLLVAAGDRDPLSRALGAQVAASLIELARDHLLPVPRMALDHLTRVLYKHALGNTVAEAAEIIKRWRLQKRGSSLASFLRDEPANLAV